jgi:hypothetical protein
MSLFSVLAYLALFIALISIFLAAMGKHPFYWLAAAGIYTFSSLAGFSIGLFTVPFAFTALALAIGFLFKWIRHPRQYFLFTLGGLVIGICAVRLAGNWLFYPFFYLFG